MIIDFTGASVDIAGTISTADERSLSVNTQTGAASFGINFQAAQLVPAPGGLGTSLPGVPLDDLGAPDILKDLSAVELAMWWGVTLPLPIEMRPDDTVASTEEESAQLVPNDSKLMPRAQLSQQIEVGLAPIGEHRAELSADFRSVLLEPAPVDMPTLESGQRLTSNPMSPEIISPSSTMDETLLAGSSLGDMRPPMSDQTLARPTVVEEPQSLDSAAPEAENPITVDRQAGFASVQSNEVHRNFPHTATQFSHSPGSISAEPRTELSEVVRHVQTMVTEHETRSTIQLEPAALGRLTLELVDAPEGLRAYVSADDPTVMRFLERNVQLLEAEARLQGVVQMSFSVGADVSGGLGHGDQRQSEAETSFRKNIEWNSASQAKPRSRRELDTNA